MPTEQEMFRAIATSEHFVGACSNWNTSVAKKSATFVDVYKCQ